MVGVAVFVIYFKPDLAITTFDASGRKVMPIIDLGAGANDYFKVRLGINQVIICFTDSS